MKLNVSYPATGCQKLFEIDDELKLRPFYDRRMGQDVSADSLGEEWKGYIVKIGGGNDKQGFPMKQGVLTASRGDNELPGLTDNSIPKRLGPKRASKIRKLFNLSKEDDVRQYVVRRPVTPKEGKEQKKPKYKAPKIQRLITPVVLQRKRHRAALRRKRMERAKKEEADYKKLLAKRAKELKEKKHEAQKRRRLSSLRASQSHSQSSQ